AAAEHRPPRGHARDHDDHARPGRPARREPQGGERMSTGAAPTEIAIHPPGAQRMGFFTDTTTCIGCKACEVACKQWNDLPSDGGELVKGGSYDHTRELNASTWRHVRFVELAESATKPVHFAHDDVDLVAAAEAYQQPLNGYGDWVFMSDVCKHCTNAGCLDACPTGALIRTEF